MFGGFDRDSYDALGDAAMGAIRVNTNLRWVGFYLAHGYAAPGSTWSSRRARAPQVSTWRFLRSEGWGRAPLFVGRQFVRVDANGNPVPIDVPAHHSVVNGEWNEANGRTDGEHAVALAQRNDAGFLVDIERGATMYLDLENDAFMAVPSARDYLRGWFHAVASGGYRPGVYCSYLTDAQQIRTTFPDVAIWLIRIPQMQANVYDEAGGRLTLPAASNYEDAEGQTPRFGRVAMQFAWYNSGRALHGAKLKTGPNSSHNVEPIDFDAARVADPAHPEDCAALTFAPFRPGQPAAFFVYSQHAGWQHFDAGAWGMWVEPAASAAATPMGDLGYGRWFDTSAAAAASRRPGLVDLFGVGIDGSVWTSWRTADVGNQAGQWPEVPQVLNPAVPARPGSPVAAVSRKTDYLDVFFINRNHELTTTWWHPGDMNWQGHTGPVTRGFSFAPATNIEALVSSGDPERLDVFAIDWENEVRWVQWRGGWQTAPSGVIGGADPALGVHGAWHAGRIHLVIGQRDGSLVHVSHSTGNIADPGWTIHGVLPSLVALARPMGIRVATIGDLLILVGIASNGSLCWGVWNGALWMPAGVHNSVPAYSASGRLAVTPFDANAIDLMLPNQNAELVVRRLTLTGNALAPLSLTHSWSF